MRGYSTEWLIILLCLVGFGYSLYAAYAAWQWTGVIGVLALTLGLALAARLADRRST